jgi:cation transport protein ChaC
VLGLDRGGRCAGVAFRIAEEVLKEELSIIWRREMLTGAYTPHWVPLRDRAGEVFGSGIAFTINQVGRNTSICRNQRSCSASPRQRAS